MTGFRDIKPHTEIASLDREAALAATGRFPIGLVAPAVGMSPTFIHKVTGQRQHLSGRDVLLLLDQDAYRETLVRRSQVLSYVEATTAGADSADGTFVPNPDGFALRVGSALDLVDQVEDGSVQCVVTSTPYWGMRTYDESTSIAWADGEVCPYGHEQTPEGFLRHTTHPPGHQPDRGDGRVDLVEPGGHVQHPDPDPEQRGDHLGEAVQPS